MKKRVLLVHNSMAEYRIAFWTYLTNLCDLTLIITNKGLEEKIYKFKNNNQSITSLYLENISKSQLKEIIKINNIIILPPVDSIKEYWIAIRILNDTNRKQKVIYWTEKWEAPWRIQPLSKKIKNLIHRFMIGSIVRNCDIAIASGTKSAEYLRLIKMPEEKIKIVIDSSTSPNSTIKIDIREIYKIPPSNKIILYMGRLISRKGCSFLIKSLITILKETNTTLLVCGDGKDLDNCKLAANNSSNIIFTGMIQPNIRKEYYRQADIFVLPSICENGIIEAWGLSVNEALECGTPVLVSNIVGAGFDLIQNHNGLIFNQNDSKDLQNKFCKMIHIDYDRKEIMKIYKEFSVKKMAEEFVKAME